MAELDARARRRCNRDIVRLFVIRSWVAGIPLSWVRRAWPWLAASILLMLAAHAAGVDETLMFRIAGQRYGAAGLATIREWRSEVTALRGAPEADQLRRVNQFVNHRIRFAEDAATWSQADYWATPVESLGRGLGDCEDYVIAKYFTLRELGVPTARLRLIYVRARIGGPSSSVTQAHMILGYYATPEAEPLVLDNLLGEIRPAGQRPDLSPVFSFNADGIYTGGNVTPVERISRWKELLIRMQAEGYAP